MISFHIVNLITLSRVKKFFLTIHSNAFDCIQAVVRLLPLKEIAKKRVVSYFNLHTRILLCSGVFGFDGDLPSKNLSTWNSPVGSLLHEMCSNIFTGRFVLNRCL